MFQLSAYSSTLLLVTSMAFGAFHPEAAESGEDSVGFSALCKTLFHILFKPIRTL